MPKIFSAAFCTDQEEVDHIINSNLVSWDDHPSDHTCQLPSSPLGNNAQQCLPSSVNPKSLNLFTD